MNVPKRPVRSTNMPPPFPFLSTGKSPHAGHFSPVSCGPFISSPLWVRAPVQSGKRSHDMNLPLLPNFQIIELLQIGHFHLSSALPRFVSLPIVLSLSFTSFWNGV